MGTDTQQCTHDAHEQSTLFPFKPFTAVSLWSRMKIHVLADGIILLHQTVRLPRSVYLSSFQTEECSGKEKPGELPDAIPFTILATVVRS